MTVIHDELSSSWVDLHHYEKIDSALSNQNKEFQPKKRSYATSYCSKIEGKRKRTKMIDPMLKQKKKLFESLKNGFHSMYWSLHLRHGCYIGT